MPEKPKFLTESVREHVRGGYNEDRGVPVIVLAEGRIKGTWYPGTTGLAIDFPGAGALVSPALQARAIRPVPKPSAKSRRKP